MDHGWRGVDGVLQWNIGTYVGRHGEGIIYQWCDMNLNGTYEL